MSSRPDTEVVEVVVDTDTEVDTADTRASAALLPVQLAQVQVKLLRREYP